MGITREVTYPVIGIIGTFHSSSTWAAATTGSTGHIFNECSTYLGQIIDRTELGANFQTVDVSLSMLGYTTGSTQGANPLGTKINLRLEHGASSGGGDMATLSQVNTCLATNFYTTVDTTDMWKASTYGGRVLNPPLSPGLVAVAPFDLNGAYRYIRSAFNIHRYVATTCTDRMENAYVANMLIFHDADKYPVRPLFENTTSTSTST